MEFTDCIMDNMGKYRIGKVYISRRTPQKTIEAITTAIKEGFTLLSFKYKFVEVLNNCIYVPQRQ